MIRFKKINKNQVRRIPQASRQAMGFDRGNCATAANASKGSTQA
jgi:hypothetical protein